MDKDEEKGLKRGTDQRQCVRSAGKEKDGKEKLNNEKKENTKRGKREEKQMKISK